MENAQNPNNDQPGEGRNELIPLALFVGIGVLFLPFVKDTVFVQRVWTGLCSVIGIDLN